MGRYVYDANLVAQSLDELTNAFNSLADITTEIQSGINTIKSATGSNCLEVNYAQLLDLQALAEDVVEEDIQTIKEKVTLIEEYENAPWWEKLWNTHRMANLKFAEGIGTFGENIIDAGASIVGFVGGLFNSDFQNSVAEFIKKDHVGDFFSEQYENGIYQDVNKYSYMSHESTAANIFKGIGVVSSHVLVAGLTAGLGTTASLGITAATAGVTKQGSSMQENLQNNMSYNAAFGDSLKDGLITAGTTLAIGGVFNKISSAAKGAGTTAISTNVRTSQNFLQRLITGAETFVIRHPVLSGAAAVAATGVSVYNRVEDSVESAQFRVAQKIFDDAIPDPTPDMPDVEIVASETPDEPTPEIPDEPEGPTPGGTNNGGGGYYPSVDPTPDNDTPSTETTTPDSDTPSTEDTTPGGDTPSGEVTTPGGDTPSTEDTTPGGDTPSGEVTTPDDNKPSGGGGYDGGGYTGEDDSNTGGTGDSITGSDSKDESDTKFFPEIDDESSLSGSFSDLIAGNDYVNIPTSSSPIVTTTTTGQKKSIIPVIAGLGAAAVAGLGTKAYLDKKENNQDEEQEDFEAEEWTGEDSLNLEYNDEIEEESDYLNPTDEYAFQEDGTEANYEAIDNNELTSL